MVCLIIPYGVIKIITIVKQYGVVLVGYSVREHSLNDTSWYYYLCERWIQIWPVATTILMQVCTLHGCSYFLYTLSLSLIDFVSKLFLSLIVVIMAKFKEIEETQIVSIANVKLQEHRHLWRLSIAAMMCCQSIVAYWWVWTFAHYLFVPFWH